jgi:diguanylate cyclase (GGDEF)-like protein
MLEAITKFFRSDKSPARLFMQEISYQLFTNIPVEIAIYDLNGYYTYANKYYAVDDKIREDIIGKDDAYYFKMVGISLDSLIKRQAHFKEILKRKSMVRFSESLYFPEKDRTIYFKRYFQPIFDKHDPQKMVGVCLFGSDLTFVILAQKELKYLSYHDRLTGLKNRDGFYEQLDQLLVDLPRTSEHKLTALLFLDLDNFKLVNDSLGHDVGDVVLQEVANRIKSSLRKSDFVFRLGGDEFTIIIRHLNREYEASKVADKLIKNISKPYLIYHHKITYLTPSIGIVFIPFGEVDREVLVKKADTAMYEAKRRGKNQYQFFKESMTEDSLMRLNIENTLQTLVKNKSFEQECRVLYQPIIERQVNGSYQIIGAEALLRWDNPELGLVMPNIFIPIAEETNLISALGDWIFERACLDANELIRKFNSAFYVSINLSAKQLKDPGFSDRIRNIIDRIGIDPTQIQFELTETTYLEDPVEIARNIDALTKMGIKLAIDDFGIGFASLVYLQRIPAATIKIDRSFIKHITSSDEHKLFVKSIITLGKNLDKEVIAEGVELPQQLYFLNEQNCFKYQGFLFSKPVSINEMQNLLTTNKDLTLNLPSIVSTVQ